MTPYYEHGGIALYLGDCREVLPALGSVKADLCMADPPYGETSLAWDKRVDGWLEAVWGAVHDRASMWVFGSMRMFLATAATFRWWHFAQDVIWEKHNGSNFHADRFKRVHEIATQWYPAGTAWAQVYKNPQTTPDATKRQVRRKKRPRHTGQIERGHYVSEDGGTRLMRSVIYERSCHGYAVHPTQKPEPILRPLIEYACPPGGLIVVPFDGSGSDLLTARLTGRRAIGVEIEEGACEKIAERLQDVLPFEAEAAP